MAVADLEVRSQIWEKGMVRMELSGVVNAETLGQLQEEFERWFATGAYSFVISMKELRRLTGVGASILVTMARIAQERGGRVVLIAPPRTVRETLERLHIMTLFEVAESLAEVATQHREEDERRSAENHLQHRIEVLERAKASKASNAEAAEHSGEEQIEPAPKQKNNKVDWQDNNAFTN